jgi:hypothetical protein
MERLNQAGSPLNFPAHKTFFLKYFIQHCFICRPSDFTVSEDAAIEPRSRSTNPGMKPAKSLAGVPARQAA